MSSMDTFVQNAVGEANSSIRRDLTLNIKKLLEESSLDPLERHLNFLAIGASLGSKAMIDTATSELQEQGVAQEQIQEAFETAAIMGMLNTYYKFKGFLPKEIADEHYQRAGLRMQSFMKPLNGKEKFEQMAFSVSVVNGCQSCVSSHEATLVELGVSREKIHDLARLAAVCKGISALT